VPKEYAQKYDKAATSEYGRHQVFTGPYMIENDASGKITGYSPGRFIKLRRNPSWDPRTDFRPAYVDRIEVMEGQADPTLGTRQILEGRDLLSADYPPPPAILKSLLGGDHERSSRSAPPAATATSR
jgi:peptide/nickel transport system substrate-binding protein